LQSELNRFRNAKITKFLLETEEKYSSQLRKINQFRNREKRVLISTSVTEEGFDIPGCNKVISFDTPFSMKAYIQIKGRARKKNSTYYIFTSEVNHKKMLENKDIYDDTINATYEIAINRIAKKEIRA
jgi:endoribonuclease Dicer